jgi:hypothetical protein
LQVPADPERVRAALERVLARPEFQDRVDPIEALLRWLARAFQGTAFESGALQIAYWVFVGFLGAGLGLLAYLVIASLWRTAWWEQRGGARSSSAAESSALRAMELRARAAQAERAGEHLLALRLYFFALLIGLSERGDLAYSDAWTNLELLERGEPQGEVRSFLTPLVEELDRKAFGRAPVSSSDVERLARIVEQRLGPVWSA